MALGYEGIGLLNGTPFLCTGMGVPQQRNRLDSASAFRGSTDPTLPVTEAIMPPHTYDWPTNDGSMSWDTSLDFFRVIKDWIVNRKTPAEVAFYPCRGSYQRFAECYWTSITLEAAEGGFLSGSANFVAINRDSDEQGNDYIENRGGILLDGVLSDYTACLLQEQLRALNPAGENLDPIPFWKGKIESASLIEAGAEPLSWTLTFNQEVAKNFACEGISLEAVEPTIVGIGPMTVEIAIELYVSVSPYELPYDVSALSVVIGDDEDGFDFEDLELQSHDQPLKTGSDTITISATYSPYTMALTSATL